VIMSVRYTPLYMFVSKLLRRPHIRSRIFLNLPEVQKQSTHVAISMSVV